ncbi:hypothetical protein NDU88_008990 [Pleurodeles waltl]|uniref:Uncharacterized protein n=1 Tax=Pleurodeles waltl TaxID=8319 RepID=A0AAV7RXB3_PLEWA|nr:hypothetical protein NDU88_008990 [Pleurodeles waltl]
MVLRHTRQPTLRFLPPAGSDPVSTALESPQLVLTCACSYVYYPLGCKIRSDVSALCGSTIPILPPSLVKHDLSTNARKTGHGSAQAQHFSSVAAKPLLLPAAYLRAPTWEGGSHQTA